MNFVLTIRNALIKKTYYQISLILRKIENDCILMIPKMTKVIKNMFFLDYKRNIYSVEKVIKV